ncbi:MAG: hypothetical protein KGV57_01370 [Fusobacterium sp.]|nr:hypothetical protein [Fusobacterium sp.]
MICKIPQFLYVPRVNTLESNTDKFIIETRKFIMWKIDLFDSYKKAVDFVIKSEKDEEEEQEGTITVHKKYPIVLTCIKIENNITMKRLVKLGTLACDWYVQFYLKENK